MREARGIQPLEDLAADVRHAVRALGASPAFTLTVILVLGGALGAATALFAVADATLLSDSRYGISDRLVRIYQTNSPTNRWSLSSVDARALLEQQRSFEAIGIARRSDVALAGAGAPERARACWGTSGFFAAAGARSEAGRLITPSDELESAPPVVVVSHAFAAERFGSEPPVGRDLVVDGIHHTIIGVLPRGVNELAGIRSRIWLPLKIKTPERRGPFWLAGIGRLRPGVSHTAARPVYIRQSISNLIEQALHGSLLAAAVILIFLRNVTSTLIISAAIPLSIMVTFIVLYFSGQTLNVFTLGGLALGIGRLVDDSIVELENIQRHLNATPRRWDAILEAAREVAMPILASTITTVVVFLPIFFVAGIARLLLIPLTITIAISLFTSFFVSRTVTPALCYKFLKPEQESHRSMPAWFVRLMDWSRERYESLDKGYEESLRWVLAHRWRFITGVLLLFATTAVLAPKIDGVFAGVG